MANTSVAKSVEVTEQEHNLGELSGANLETAKSLFELHGVVTWQSLWLRHDQNPDQEALNRLGSLPTENSFIYVKTRSALPQEIVNNKVGGYGISLFSYDPTDCQDSTLWLF